MRVYSLSIHADYRCAHSGACCTSGWPIPVERQTAVALAERIAHGELVMTTANEHRARSAPALFVPVDDAPAETPVVAAVRQDGSCVFYERECGLCAIHRLAGPELLPVACRQFPRISLVDGRGLFVTVSHYCPTAASLLFREDCRLEIVESPASFPPDFPYDPLDAREALPPLLSPGVLMDLETYGRWEREVVNILARPDVSPEAAVSSIVQFAEALRAWQPGKQSLGSHVDEVLQQTRRTAPEARSSPARAPQAFRSGSARRDYELILASIPESHRPLVWLDSVADSYERYVAADWSSFARPACRYVAAKAFGCWLSYQGRGLRTIARSLVVALSALKVNAALESEKARGPLTRVVFTSAVRRTDQMLAHLASREALARALGGTEKVAGAVSSDVR